MSTYDETARQAANEYLSVEPHIENPNGRDGWLEEVAEAYEVSVDTLKSWIEQREVELRD